MYDLINRPIGGFLNPKSFIDRFEDIWGKSLDDFFFRPLHTKLSNDFVIEKMDDNKSMLIYEMPGVNKDDLKVTYQEDDRLLTISAETKDEKKSFYYNGYKRNKIQRAWTIPKDTKVIDATLEDGLLKITLEDNAPEEKKPLEIPVK